MCPFPRKNKCFGFCVQYLNPLWLAIEKLAVIRASIGLDQITSISVRCLTDL